MAQNQAHSRCFTKCLIPWKRWEIWDGYLSSQVLRQGHKHRWYRLKWVWDTIFTHSLNMSTWPSQRDPGDDTRRMSQAYLPPHDSNLLMELAPIETRIFLQKKGRRRYKLHECLRRTHFPPPTRNFLRKPSGGLVMFIPTPMTPCLTERKIENK